jgi:hypothetical protein
VLFKDEPHGSGKIDGVADDIDGPSTELVGKRNPEKVSRSLAEVKSQGSAQGKTTKKAVGLLTSTRAVIVKKYATRATDWLGAS